MKKENKLMGEAKNEIVVYQPNETMRLDVRLENETVWLTQSQMGILFGCTTRNVRLHLENIYSCGELTQEATRKDFFLVRQELPRPIPSHRQQDALRIWRVAEGSRRQVLCVHEA